VQAAEQQHQTMTLIPTANNTQNSQRDK